jgi:polyisoprenoid-binding protein YceI
VLVPLSGWIHHAAASGFAPIWWPFGQNLPLVPKSEVVASAMGGVHWVLTKVLALSLLLHIAGALKHHLIDRDATLRRMLPGTPDLPALPPIPHPRAPLFVGAALWAAALGLAGAMGAGAKPETAAAPTLTEVSSQWQVEQGEVSLTVTQFGNEVTGRFEDWTAQINFDPASLSGVAGNVVATISIPSLTLGSVTDQALGVDFLDGTNHPTAVFDAEISVASDGYEAVGTLTIKDNSVPVRLPFALDIKGDRAEMRGDLALDRSDFGVGDTITDTQTLGFGVDIKVTLIATRQEN